MAQAVANLRITTVPSN